MKDINKISNSVGAIGTLILCILFVLVCVFFKIPEKPVYKTINITLDTTPVTKAEKITKDDNKVLQNTVETTDYKESEVLNKSSESQKKESITEIQEKTTNTIKNNVQTSKSESTSESSVKKTSEVKKTDKTEQPVYKKSLEELAQQQKSTVKKKVEWNEDLFGDEDSSSGTENNNNNDVFENASLTSSISGSAAIADSNNSSTVTGKSYSSDKIDLSEDSSSVNDSLNSIRSQKYSDTSVSGIVSTVSMDVGSSGDKEAIKMSNGKLRELLNPKKTTIYISSENAKLLDSSRTVKISFYVLANGTVPIGEILINPSLPFELENEIKKQISTWTFVSDKDGGKAQATFVYTLEIR